MKWLPQSRRRKLVLVAVAVLGLFLLSTGWLASRFLDLEGARLQVAAELGEKLHRRVEIGRLSVGFFSATLRHITIYDRKEFGPPPFVTIRYASGSVNPLELLRGRLKISRIKARRPTVIIKRNSAGELNLHDLLSAEKPTETHDRFDTTHTSASDLSRKKWGEWKSVDVESVRLSAAAIRFEDEERKARYVIPYLDVTCQGSLGGNPVKVEKARIGFGPLWIELCGEATRDLKRGWFALRMGDVNLMAFKRYLAFLSGFESGRWLIQNTRLQGKIHNAIFIVEDLSCRPSYGSLKGNAKFWVERGKPAFFVDVQFEGIELEPFLWQTRTDRVSFGGTLSGKCSLSSVGISWDDLKRELMGTADLRVSRGRFQNKVFIEIGKAAKEFLGIRELDEYRAHAQGTFDISDGKITSSDLKFDSGFLDIYLTGPGFVTLDGALWVPKVMVRAGDEKESLQVPIKIKGTVNKPKVDIEWKSLRKSLIGK